MTSFLKDSMMNVVMLKMAVCNQSGTIAIYNKEQNHFYSLLKDLINSDIESFYKYGKNSVY